MILTTRFLFLCKGRDQDTTELVDLYSSSPWHAPINYNNLQKTLPPSICAVQWVLPSNVLNRSASYSSNTQTQILICFPEIKETYSLINEVNFRKSPPLALLFTFFFSYLASQHNGKHDQEVLNEDKHHRYDKIKVAHFFSSDSSLHSTYFFYHIPVQCKDNVKMQSPIPFNPSKQSFRCSCLLCELPHPQ